MDRVSLIYNSRSQFAILIALSIHAHKNRSENSESIVAAENFLRGALGVGHQAEDIARAVGDARDVALRAVGISFRRRAALGVAVGEEDLLVREERAERRFVGDVMALAVRDGQGAAPGRPVYFMVKRDSGFSTRMGIVSQRKCRLVLRTSTAGEQARLAQNLKAVANAEHGLPAAAASLTAGMMGEKRGRSRRNEDNRRRKIRRGR